MFVIFIVFIIMFDKDCRSIRIIMVITNKITVIRSITGEVRDIMCLSDILWIAKSGSGKFRQHEPQVK